MSRTTTVFRSSRHRAGRIALGALVTAAALALAASSSSAITALTSSFVWVFAGPLPINELQSNFAGHRFGSGFTASGRATAIAVNPNLAGQLMVGFASAGLWRSNDGGASFSYGVTYAYSMNRADADLIEGDSGADGLWRATSTDSGATWSHWRYSDSEGLTRLPGKPGRAAEYGSALTGHARSGEASVPSSFTRGG